MAFLRSFVSFLCLCVRMRIASLHFLVYFCIGWARIFEQTLLIVRAQTSETIVRFFFVCVCLAPMSHVIGI